MAKTRFDNSDSQLEFLTCKQCGTLYASASGDDVCDECLGLYESDTATVVEGYEMEERYGR